MNINTTVTRLTKWILNPLRLIWTVIAAPSFFRRPPGGSPPDDSVHQVHPPQPLKFPIKSTLQKIQEPDYRLMLVENKERLNRIRYSLETSIPVDANHVLIRGVDNSDFINRFCEYRNLSRR
jgi:hypothetical protein